MDRSGPHLGRNVKDKRNPVAKVANEFNKPKTHRDRKKEFKLGEDKREIPKHQPYARCPTNLANLLLEDDEQE